MLNPQIIDKAKTVEIGETSNSPAKVMSVLEIVAVSSEVVMLGDVEKYHKLTVAEKDYVKTSNEEDMVDLNAFKNEKLQFMTEKGLEQLVGDESVNVEEILSGNVAAVSGHSVGYEGTVGPEVDQARTTSVCPGLKLSANVEGSGYEVSFHERHEVHRMLREELGGPRVTSTPVKGLWPIYSKRRSSVLGGHGAPPCKSKRFGVSDTIGAVEFGNLSRSCIPEVSGGVEGSDFTCGGFSTLEAIAKKKADNRDGGLYELPSSDGVVRVPRVESIVEQEGVGGEKSRYFPSQSATSLLKDFFELNPPIYLDPSHPTTSFSADQTIQVASAVGLEVFLASYGMLENLLLKARVGGRDQTVGSRVSVGRSPFPSVAGYSWGEIVASRTKYSFRTVTGTDKSNVVAGAESLQEPSSSRQAVARLAAQNVGGEKPGSDSLKTLQEIKRGEKEKRQSKM